MNHMNSVYQILKAIDVAFENQDFELERDLDLKKLKISEHRRALIIENIYNDGFIDGLSVTRGCDGDVVIGRSSPRLTLDGMDYLENNSSMKKAYAVLKEIKEWIPGY